MQAITQIVFNNSFDIELGHNLNDKTIKVSHNLWLDIANNSKIDFRVSNDNIRYIIGENDVKIELDDTLIGDKRIKINEDLLNQLIEANIE